MKVKLDFGAEVDFLTKDELDSALATAFDQAELARIRAVKWMRLPESVTGKAVSSALSLGESTGQVCGPRSGYVWSVRRLVVTGLTSGSAPDVVNLYRGTGAGPVVWQFNGNSFGYTFGKGQMTLNGGETFALASVGAFASTSQITLSGEVVEAPAELAAKVTT
jgi:hypothetical protein